MRACAGVLLSFVIISCLFLLFAACAGVQSSDQQMDSKQQAADSSASVPDSQHRSDSETMDPDPGAVFIPQHRIASLESLYPHVSRYMRGFLPVIDRGKMSGWIQDLNGNGHEDAVFLMVEEASLTRELEHLSRERRLFDSGSRSAFFAVYIFRFREWASNDALPLFDVEKMEIGSYRVLKSFTRLALGEAFPFALDLTLMNEQLSVRHWLFLDAESSMLRLVDSPWRKSIVTDLDDTGLVDVVFHERFFEDGSGEETFLIWNKWDGRRFREYSTTNIVRNLNGFLQQLAYLVEHRYWHRFLRYAVNMESVNMDVMKKPDVIFRQYFEPTGNFDRVELENVGQVRFSDILENPFSSGNNTVRIPCRISSDELYFYYVYVRLSDNPFIQPQYTLMPVPDKR